MGGTSDIVASTQASAAALVGKQVARLWTLPDNKNQWFVGEVKSYRRDQVEDEDDWDEGYLLRVVYEDGDEEELTVRPAAAAHSRPLRPDFTSGPVP